RRMARRSSRTSRRGPPGLNRPRTRMLAHAGAHGTCELAHGRHETSAGALTVPRKPAVQMAHRVRAPTPRERCPGGCPDVLTHRYNWPAKRDLRPEIRATFDYAVARGAPPEGAISRRVRTHHRVLPPGTVRSSLDGPLCGAAFGGGHGGRGRCSCSRERAVEQ